MSTYALLVINNPLFEDELKVQLKQLFAQEFSHGEDSRLILDFENDVKNATARVKESKVEYNLLIVDLHICPDSGTPFHENQKEGLKFLKGLRDARIPFFAILICPDSDQEVADFPATCTSGMSCEILLQKGDWVRYFEDKVRKGLGRCLAAVKKMGIVDIYLEQGKKDRRQHRVARQDNTYFMEGKGFDFEPRFGVLKEIGELDTEQLIWQSKQLGEASRWDKELYFIGGRLLKCLSDDNPDFKYDFKDLVEKAGGVENIRIRYIVEENIHPIALEAIIDEEKRYRMLHCPIFRSVNIKCENAPLFKDAETQTGLINCLVINANCEGAPEWGTGVNGPSLKLKLLKKAEAETRRLEAMLAGTETPGYAAAVNHVCTLSADAGDDGFYGQVERVLEKGPWHVVHFVGHSHYEEQSHKGHVFFPGKRGKPIPVAIEDFAETLGKADVRLVYLSSCFSADVDFVFKLSENNIPATLGFRCPINDEKAMEHALVFYEKLFLGSKRLEYAFLDTRKELQRRYGETDPIWAVSILTMQEKQSARTL